MNLNLSKVLASKEELNREVEERRRAEDELKKTLADLERSNKELEQFAYVASHDLQEPLRMVSSYTQLLGERYGDQLDEKAKKFINYAVDGAVRMQQLIQDLLLFSRVTTRGEEFQPVDSGAALGMAMSSLGETIRQSGALVTNDDDFPQVIADQPQLAQVFQNLISNAIKFRGQKQPRIHVSVQEQDLHWLFSVEDNGIGIDPRHTGKVFVIFQRLHTREEYPGTGIGLALCERIIKRHRGEIWFDSKPGEGSTFYFTFPKTTEEGHSDEP
jgi:light-regulated signal transduction histidine kinase (bacteriophytochrome)